MYKRQASDDEFAVADTSDSGTVKKMSVSSLGAYMATNASSGYAIRSFNGLLYFKPSDLGTMGETIDPANDTLVIDDVNDGTTLAKKTTIASVVDAIRGTTTTTGLASSSGVLSIDIQNQASVTPAAGDYVLIADADDSYALKRVTVSSIQGNLDLNGLNAADVDVANDSLSLIHISEPTRRS